jgi:hypothetical protein
MLLQPVTPELMLLANEVLTRPQRKLDVINTLLQEQRQFDFDEIWSAHHRLQALWSAISELRFEEWTLRVPGSVYCEVSPALWNAAASAALSTGFDDICSSDVLKFDIGELRQLARDYTAPKTNS